MTTPSRSLRVCISWFALAAAVQFARAQSTESARTVEPGKFLVEMDGLTLSYNRADAAGNRYDAVGIASTLVTTGLTSSVDLQVGFDLFWREKIDLRGSHNSHSGIGDLYFRTKWTFWRDDKRGAAAAVIPYVKVPSNRDGIGNDSIEGGVIVPWEMELGAGFTAGAQARWDVVRNDADNGYDAQWEVSGYVHRTLGLGIGVYAEAALNAASTGWRDRSGKIGVGALWRWSERLDFDYEIMHGLNRQESAWTHVFRFNWGW